MRKSMPLTERQTNLRLFVLLIDKLPEQWTEQERALWLNAFTKSLDLVIERIAGA